MIIFSGIFAIFYLMAIIIWYLTIAAFWTFYFLIKATIVIIGTMIVGIVALLAGDKLSRANLRRVFTQDILSWSPKKTH